jgi:hypothetical protein
MSRRSFPVCIIAAPRSFPCLDFYILQHLSPNRGCRSQNKTFPNGINRYRTSSRDVGILKGQTNRATQDYETFTKLHSGSDTCKCSLPKKC